MQGVFVSTFKSGILLDMRGKPPTKKGTFNVIEIDKNSILSANIKIKKSI